MPDRFFIPTTPLCGGLIRPPWVRRCDPHISPSVFLLLFPSRPPSPTWGLPVDCAPIQSTYRYFFGISLSFVPLVHAPIAPHLDPVVPFLRSLGTCFSPFLVDGDAERCGVLLSWLKPVKLLSFRIPCTPLWFSQHSYRKERGERPPDCKRLGA